MVPGSPFIEHIFSRSLNDKVVYYLFFSYKGECSLFMDNNDGAVTLKSQLDLRAQEDAVAKWGFDEGHVAILSSPDALAKYEEILANPGGKADNGPGFFGWDAWTDKVLKRVP
jgi:hypothetical protein